MTVVSEKSAAAEVLLWFMRQKDGKRCLRVTMKSEPTTYVKGQYGIIRGWAAVKGTEEYCRGTIRVSRKERRVWEWHDRKYVAVKQERFWAECDECGSASGSRWFVMGIVKAP